MVLLAIYSSVWAKWGQRTSTHRVSRANDGRVWWDELATNCETIFRGLPAAGAEQGGIEAHCFIDDRVEMRQLAELMDILNVVNGDQLLVYLLGVLWVLA